VCVQFNGNAQGVSVVTGVSLSGRTTTPTSVSYGALQRVTLSAPIGQDHPTVAGAASESTDPAVGTTWTYSGPTLSPAQLTLMASAPQPVIAANLTVTVTRGASATAPTSFGGNFSLTTATGTINGSISGEAVQSGGAWHLRGSSVLTTGSAGANSGLGGFTADITLGNPGSGDDVVSWNVDSIVS